MVTVTPERVAVPRADGKIVEVLVESADGSSPRRAFASAHFQRHLRAANEAAEMPTKMMPMRRFTKALGWLAAEFDAGALAAIKRMM